MTMIEKLKNAARPDSKDRLYVIAEEAKRRGTDLIEDAQTQGARALRGSRSWVIRNPGAAVGFAFVAGVVATALVRRGSRD
jgi:hypothetical protein